MMLYFWLRYIPSSIKETKVIWDLMTFHVQKNCLSVVLNS